MKAAAIGTKKLIKIIVWCILGAIGLFIIIALSSLLVQKYVKKEPVPMFAGRGYLIVVTGSMSPTIDKGDLIIIKKADEYKIHDVITFVLSNGEVVTHAIVNYGDEEGTFITKGDANTDIDQLDINVPPISLDQIQGKVVTTIPKVGIFFEWFTDDSGYIYAIALLIIIIVGIYLWDRIKSDPEEETPDGDPPADQPKTDLQDVAAVHSAETDAQADPPKDSV